jgi:hypothetical protein
MSGVVLSAPIKIAEPSPAEVSSPFSVKSPSRSLFASKILISAVKAPYSSELICAPTPSTGVANASVMSGPTFSSHRSGVPSEKFPLQPSPWSRRSNTPPTELTVAARPFVELTVSGLVNVV